MSNIKANMVRTTVSEDVGGYWIANNCYVCMIYHTSHSINDSE